MKNKWHELEAYFGLSFKDETLLERALTHSSYANEQHTKSNQRLEFLGDAVIDLAVGKYLFDKMPDDEGVLTKKRAQEVCEASLAEFARSFHLGDYLRLGKGEEKNQGRERPAVLADAFEAFLGAIFLDKGLKEVYKVLDKVVFPAIEANLGTADDDYKSTLQELVQSEKRTLEYVIEAETGPSHAKEFVACVRFIDENIILGRGGGTTKKQAEQNAARAALELLAPGDISDEE
ncbi:MAG: ribonuclease III [bacterium]